MDEALFDAKYVYGGATWSGSAKSDKADEKKAKTNADALVEALEKELGRGAK